MGIVLIVLVTLGFIVTVLAYIGLKVKKTEEIVKKQIETEKRNQRKIVRLNDKILKRKRQKTPRV